MVIKHVSNINFILHKYLYFYLNHFCFIASIKLNVQLSRILISTFQVQTNCKSNSVCMPVTFLLLSLCSDYNEIWYGNTIFLRKFIGYSLIRQSTYTGAAEPVSYNYFMIVNLKHGKTSNRQ